MGIGRFAFTPLLPIMLAEGSVDLAGASLLASANYFGYLLGALLCTSQPWLWRRFPALPPLDSPSLVRNSRISPKSRKLRLIALNDDDQKLEEHCKVKDKVDFTGAFRHSYGSLLLITRTAVIKPKDLRPHRAIEGHR